MKLEEILSEIAKGGRISATELLPYLCLGHRDQRARVNFLLAQAYMQSGRGDFLPHAQTCIQRAWQLSRFSRDLLPLLIEIHLALGDVATIREAYKRLGMESAREKNIDEAIKYFNLSHSAYWRFQNTDRYEYDFDILERLDNLAGPYRLSPKPRPDLLSSKLRIAYLVQGITELGSSLIKINLLLAQFHDRSRVEAIFFAPEAEAVVMASAAGRSHVQQFKSLGFKLYTGSNNVGTEGRLLGMAQLILDHKPDLLVTSAALAELEHYFVTTLRPAPFIFGLVQGPPPQFAAPMMDWGIAWSKHPLMDCPIDCTRITMADELLQSANVPPYERTELGIPRNAQVVVSAGRHVKFQNRAYWEAIIEFLNERPDVYYLIMGVKENQIPFLGSLLSESLRARIRFLEWAGSEYRRGLRLADVLIDTFPSGGGAILLDATALGIPCISFQNDYMKQYDQTEWSLGDELISIPELLIPRCDFEAMKSLLARLLDEEQYRHEIGQRLQQFAEETWGNPSHSVRQCEETYFRVLEEKLAEKSVTDELEIEIDELTRRLAALQVRRNPVARAAHQLSRGFRFGERILTRIARGRDGAMRWPA